ncbi:hypothetical protein [Streptomyces alkaliterrae]|uniref:Uncharacterized protein n=1 Tax=Streptomyces alkaliterrae TaxID=2213162 RepID=A0A5P0YRI5_9ACTN|nr:hypothetical protein [Streptomyces alkaliterrae]MBB1252170.1 hypothetical protein [Streptomyces alkaliterrae]MBB1258564.1 hypothetical protein [Streptomyces alkaliterrae]MQS02933.1 hypothetical protein [Streptomyces alkaliterrae]
MVPPRPPRSSTGLGGLARIGHAGALTVLVWQLFVMWRWRLPFEKSAEMAPHWSAPFELAEALAASAQFGEHRVTVLSWGPPLPWFLPACAVLAVVLLRAVRLPNGFQWLLGSCAAGYGLLALYVNGPLYLRHWPLTTLLFVVSLWALYRIRIR